MAYSSNLKSIHQYLRGVQHVALVHDCRFSHKCAKQVSHNEHWGLPLCPYCTVVQ